MAKYFAMETVDKTLRDFMNNIELFGGEIVVFGDDLRQVLLIVPKGTREETVYASLVRSYLVANGEEPTIDEDNIEIPKEMVIKHDANNDCEMMIEMFPRQGQLYNSYDEAVDDTNKYYQEEFLNTLQLNGLSPHRLELGVNCPIILLRNLDASNGLCNGTRMTKQKKGKKLIQKTWSTKKYCCSKVLLLCDGFLSLIDSLLSHHVKKLTFLKGVYAISKRIQTGEADYTDLFTNNRQFRFSGRPSGQLRSITLEQTQSEPEVRAWNQNCAPQPLMLKLIN
ncbi:uncharacterized protein LOC126681607 [Mercurialis annua]|uniref:uncharacterized protein LOC126681607 n=1 Tax=Mercurialis annua TaxID=3986 RepID=UPI00215EEC71|nr:uncharacterized protein LOC126681607 [Mercurialis annua]